MQHVGKKEAVSAMLCKQHEKATIAHPRHHELSDNVHRGEQACSSTHTPSDPRTYQSSLAMCHTPVAPVVQQNVRALSGAL